MPSQGNATVTQVAAADSNTALATAKKHRVGLIIRNDSTDTLYIKYGATASASDYTDALVGAGTHTVHEKYANGQVDGIWSATPSGNAYVTEIF